MKSQGRMGSLLKTQHTVAFLARLQMSDIVSSPVGRSAVQRQQGCDGRRTVDGPTKAGGSHCHGGAAAPIILTEINGLRSRCVCWRHVAVAWRTGQSRGHDMARREEQGRELSTFASSPLSGALEKLPVVLGRKFASRK